MNFARALTPKVLLIFIISVAALLRLIGLDWSLPHTYEEATPLRAAVGMWGWPEPQSIDLNPGFFNYPSLTLYMHFVVQGVLFLILRLTGEIASATDWYVLFLTNPTPQYLAARLVGVVFGTLTVFLIFKTASAAIGPRGGLVAALLLATNPYHIARSQMIEVDVPLTFFVVLSMYAMTRVIRRGKTADYALCGLAVGLAASCKYTGAVLVAPLLAAHVFRFGLSPRQPRRWLPVIGAILLAAAVFAATSPYVLIEWHRFQAAFSVEREHMELGHFGTDSSPTWLFYARAMVTQMGIAGMLLALLGGIDSLIRTRSRHVLVVLVFIVAYLGTIASWSMKADRYLLPVLPIASMLAAVGLVAIHDRAATRLSVRVRLALVGIAVMILLARNLAGITGSRDTLQHDLRTDALEWIEGNVPAGSFVVSEHYGPDLLDPSLLYQLNPEVRAQALAKWRGRPLYAFMSLPMYQARPELSAPFYATSAYPEADYFITTRSIRARYEKDPLRFGAQLAFYRQLGLQFMKVREFSNKNGDQLTIYKSSVHTEPFGVRTAVAAPPVINRTPGESTGRESGYYFTLGTNYEYFRHRNEAAACYLRAMEYGTTNDQLTFQCVLGYARCMVALGRRDEASETLGRLHRRIRNDRLKSMIGELMSRMRGSQTR